MRELTQLQYFRTVARLEHITRAAEELHISQPNLSNAIRRLEADLGVELFERRNGRVFLNDYGRVYLEAVNRAFECLDSGEQQLRTMMERDTDNHLSMASTMQLYNEELIELFFQKNPNSPLRISQDLTSPEGIRQQFWEGRLDLAFIPEMELPPIVTWERLFTCRVCVLMAQDHPMARGGSIALRDLARIPFVCNNLGIRRSMTEVFCQKAGFQPRIVFESNDSMSIGRWIEQGRGVSLISSYDQMTLSRQNSPVRILPISEPELLLPMGLAKRMDGVFQGGRKRFLAFAYEYFQELGRKLEQF